MKYPVYLLKDADSDYGVTVPDLPGCFSAGVTVQEALENAAEAILTHIEGMILDNEEIPAPGDIDSRRKEAPAEAIWALVPVDFLLLDDKAKRINITVPERVLSKIDAFTGKSGESRSGFLVTAALEYMSHHMDKAG